MLINMCVCEDFKIYQGKFFHSTFVHWMRALNPIVTMVLFNKNRQLLSLGFSFTPHLTFTTHTLHLLLLTDTHHIAMWPAKVVKQFKK